jgi:nitroreductase
VLLECLELALQAPTGSNAQGWQWVFVEDADKKKALAEIYRTNATPYLDQPKPEYGDARDEQRPRVHDSAKYLNEHLHEVPAMLIPCLEGRPDRAPAGLSASFWGSLLPAVWSFMLALRSRGLGSAWTTLHLVGDGEKQAADVLGIPFEKYSQGGLFPNRLYQGRRLSSCQAAARRAGRALGQLVIFFASSSEGESDGAGEPVLAPCLIDGDGRGVG